MTNDAPSTEPAATPVAEGPTEAPTRLALAWSWLKPVLRIGVPVLAIWLVWHELHGLDARAVRAEVLAADARWLWAGGACALAAVVVMGLYDALAFPRGEKLGFGRRWLIGSVIFGWTNFISLGPIGGPAIRVLAYRRHGLGPPELARGFLGHAVGMASGLAAWLAGALAPGPDWLRIATAMALAPTIAVASGRLAARYARRHELGSQTDAMPFARLGLVSFLDWGLTIASFVCIGRALHVGIPPLDAARAMLLGHAAGIASMVPGGLGTADAVWLAQLARSGVSHADAGAVVVLFRAVFYAMPWVASLLVLYGWFLGRSERLRAWQRRIVAGAVTLNALLLLASAATPALRDRLDMLENAVPLGAIEASHAVAVLSAGIMLFLVRGLVKGYRSAMLATAGLLAASAVAHPLKGVDIEEGLVSLALLAMLLGVRGAFTRRGRAGPAVETALATGAGAVGFFLVVGFGAFARVPYRPELWEEFAARAEASRFLRAAVLLGLVALALVIREAASPRKGRARMTDAEIDAALPRLRALSHDADALLLANGDKALFEREKLGMVVYQRIGSRAIVFGDPAAAPGRMEPLLTELHAWAEEEDLELLFYEMSNEVAGALHEFGYYRFKLGEEAVVPLAGFSLGGGRNAQHRRTIRAMEAAGLRFEVREPPFDPAFVEGLRAVSDAWLAAKGVREMQGSVGSFSEAYLARAPVGVAVDADGVPAAFVNLLRTRSGGPTTIDLMRYRPGVVDNLMDAVLMKSMEWCAAQGDASFSLGMAPLADVGQHRRSFLAERVASRVFTHAERIYNYRGLRAYKEKFHPDWQGRYLCYRRPWGLVPAVAACTSYIRAWRPEDRRRMAADADRRLSTPR
jgi:phosphatidylglycerol lysyltransferase